MTIKTKNIQGELGGINRQIKDIETLVNEFSNFARMPAPMLKKTNIYSTIKRATDFLNHSIKSEIKIDCLEKDSFITGDEDQIYRVFINLIKNSDESISEIRLKNSLYKGKIDIEIKSNNDYIGIQLIDNGCGIIDAKKIMTPYFTTKKTGTGLGLPIVSKIINEHNGDLSISNNDNKEGAVVLIKLPLNYEK